MLAKAAGGRDELLYRETHHWDNYFFMWVWYLGTKSWLGRRDYAVNGWMDIFSSRGECVYMASPVG